MKIQTVSLISWLPMDTLPNMVLHFIIKLLCFKALNLFPKKLSVLAVIFLILVTNYFIPTLHFISVFYTILCRFCYLHKNHTASFLLFILQLPDNILILCCRLKGCEKRYSQNSTRNSKFLVLHMAW